MRILNDVRFLVERKLHKMSIRERVKVKSNDAADLAMSMLFSIIFLNTKNCQIYCLLAELEQITNYDRTVEINATKP